MVTLKSGFILPIVLLFLQLFSMLGLFGLQQILYGTQFIALHQRKMQVLNSINEILTQIEQMPYDQSCLLETTLDFTKQPFNWWQAHACYGRHTDISFYYCVENLGQDPCAVQADNRNIVANYFRYTVYVIVESAINSKLIIQSTYAKPSELTSICKGKSRLALFGRQMWLEVY